MCYVLCKVYLMILSMMSDFLSFDFDLIVILIRIQEVCGFG